MKKKSEKPAPADSGATERKTAPADPIKKMKMDWWVLLLFLVLIPWSIFLRTGLATIDQFETADEHLWINDLYEGRIHRYWYAMADGDWGGTRINDKPGVSLAYVSGLGLLQQTDVRATVQRKDNTSINYVPEETAKLYRIFRTPLVIFNSLLGLVFLLLIWKTTRDKLVSLVAATLILLSPILLGISQIINPDALLWSSGFASILSFLFFLRSGKFIGGFLAAFFLGVALLSKYVSLILIPFFFIMALVYLFFEAENLEKEELMKKRLRQVFIGYPLVIAGGIGLFALLMPALLVKQGLLYSSTIGFKGVGMILEYCLIADAILLIDALLFKGFSFRFLEKKLRWLKEILPRLLYVFLLALFATSLYDWSARGGNFLQLTGYNLPLISWKEYWLNYITVSKPLVFSLPPVIIILVAFLWTKSLFKRSASDYIVFPLSFFYLVYFYTIFRLDVPSVTRYFILLFPITLLLAAIGLGEAIRLLPGKNKLLAGVVSGIALLLIAGNAYQQLRNIAPFYFNYSNSWLAKGDTVAYGWGYGGYQAAQYINSQLADPAKGKIWSDYYGVCPFFPGKCVMEGSIKWLNRSSLDSFDFYVTSTKGSTKNKSGWKKALRSGNVSDEPVWELDIDGRSANFVKVYKNKNKSQDSADSAQE